MEVSVRPTGDGVVVETAPDGDPRGELRTDMIFTRASQAPPAAAPRVYENLEIRVDEMQALVGGRRVGLTIREFQVLSVLSEHEDRVLRRSEIYHRVWGGDMKHRDRSVDVFVRKLRTKMARVAPDWIYIHTHFGIGYRFAPQALTSDADDDAPDLP